jgi:hypothetical protein
MSLESAKLAKVQIVQVLHCSPRRYGIARSRWRLQDLRQIVPWLKDCTLSGVHQILKRLKISLKQATSYVNSPDPDWSLKRQRMVQVFLAAICHPEQYVILFLDELTYYLQPDHTLKYGAVGKPAPPVHHAAQGNPYTRIGALMNGLTGQVCYLQRDKFGKLALEELYQMIRKLYPKRRLFVVQDNCSFHYSDNVLQTAEALDIHPVFLPTYASWLNPIEKLWRWLKADVLHAHEFAHNIQLLRQTVAQFLDQFSNPSPALLRYVGLLPD